MADVMANEALSRILVSCAASALPAVSLSLSFSLCAPARMPVAICGLSWLSEHACILFFMHYHVTVRHFSPSLSLSLSLPLPLLVVVRLLSLLFMLYLYVYALPACKQ